jgi:hypothetical protein
MYQKPNYTKVNATYESCHVLNILAAERQAPVYTVLDDFLRAHFPDYFTKIETQSATK